MLNTKFGFVNQILLGGAEIDWLGDPTLARAAVLFVQLWVGFPYMFLICTGALQSIPEDVIEASKIDGAGRIRIWRSVDHAPVAAPRRDSSADLVILLQFQQLQHHEMLTQGGPRFADASVPIGATDILITMVYSISGLDGGAKELRARQCDVDHHLPDRRGRVRD